jgi:hypothetical protein
LAVLLFAAVGAALIFTARPDSPPAPQQAEALPPPVVHHYRPPPAAAPTEAPRTEVVAAADSTPADPPEELPDTAPPGPPPAPVPAVASAAVEARDVTPPPDPAPPPRFNRRDGRDEYDLARALKAVAQDIDLGEDACRKLLGKPADGQRRAAKESKDRRPASVTLADLTASRTDFAGLPIRGDTECRATAAETLALQDFSRDFRRSTAQLDRALRRQATGSAFDSLSQTYERNRRLFDFLKEKKEWLKEDKVAGLVQVLQAEDSPVRLQLVAMLAKVKGPAAGAALARRAVFDLNSDVREAAVEALKDRPDGEYRAVLLGAFRHPWPPAADHAAEALVALRDRGAVRPLADLLDRPDPAAPARDADGRWGVAEVVRVNHLRNCLLCHAPSADGSGLVRGLIPTPGEPLRVEYYESNQGDFVRADVTYLRQDFSRTEDVPNADPWPTRQRFDYLVRVRPPTSGELETALNRPPDLPPPSYPQRGAVLFALRELTGADAGDTADDWRAFLEEAWTDPGP